jgi:hypothetical protein
MATKYNERPISLREGKVFINGVAVLDSVKASIIVSLETWTGYALGDRTPSTRITGGAYSGKITRRRSTPFLDDIVKTFMETGETVEFTLQGIMDDKNSDYYDGYGGKTVTFVGCVLTGTVNLLTLDTNGGVWEDEIAFNAKNQV